MNKTNSVARLFSAILVLACLALAASGQQAEVSEPNQIKRTKSISQSVKFGPGGTISVIGAPVGAISIEGWHRNEVSISAEISVFGQTEEEVARIAGVTGFYVDEDVLHVRIYTVGPHDKKYLKKVDKSFPKKLRNNLFSVDYKVYVPTFSDLRINGGQGDFSLKAVEGVFDVNYLRSNAILSLVGGNVHVTVGSGDLDVTIATRSWRGRSADIQVAKGNIDLRLPKNLNAELMAKILRSGRITNAYESLKAKDRTEFSESFMFAKAGNGGARLAFTVGDGNLNILDSEKPSR